MAAHKNPKFCGVELKPISDEGDYFNAKIGSCQVSVWTQSGTWRAECVSPDTVYFVGGAATAGTALRALKSRLQGEHRALATVLSGPKKRVGILDIPSSFMAAGVKSQIKFKRKARK